jgi:pimeloyl-ACP methyl ester carboxylesterase
MTRTIYALLVGIDNYPRGANSLAGCVNDIRRVEQLLLERKVGADDRFAPLILTDAAATRQAIIDGFRTHLAQAGRDDVALFYYSGHGSQQPSPKEFWHLEPDGLDETLVCYDSRSTTWDLADKELAQLIAEVAENGGHVVAVLDCCHSGSGTRNLDMPAEGVRIRRVPTDQRQRPLESFLVSPEQASTFQPASRGGGQGGWYSLPVGRHVVLSACSAEEEAKEFYLGGEQRGAFSYYLLDTLQRTGEPLSYRDVFKRVNAQVRLQVSAQSPQMEATQIEDLNQPFLGGAIQPTAPYFTVAYDRQRQWVIDGGALHGIPAPGKAETTQLALFRADAGRDQLRDLAAAIGTARVREVFPGQSAVEVALAQGATADTGSTYKAVVTALSLPPLVVALEGDEAALASLRMALASAGPEGQGSLTVREGTRQEAEFYVDAVDNRYRIRRKGDEFALIVDTPEFGVVGAQLTVQRLEHIARWLTVGRLENPVTEIGQDAVQLEIEVQSRDGAWQPAPIGSNVRLEYQLVEGAWRAPQFKLKLTNTANRRLYCMLFDLPETYGISPILPGGGVWLAPGETEWLNRGEPLHGVVRDEPWQAGVIEFKDTLKIIVSSEESDATLLAQDDLPVTVQTRRTPRTRSLAHLHTLNRLMNRVSRRDLISTPPNTEALADWSASEVSFAVVRPLETTPVPADGQRATLGHGVTLRGHATLQGNARLADLPQASRDAGNLTLPAMIRDHPEVFKPFEFTSSRGGEPGLSVLELVDVEDYESVTHDAPLVIELDRPLAKDEALLALGFDGEFYLPLGHARRLEKSTEVVLERLPTPTNQGRRDLKGAIRIYFQKVVGARIGLEFSYPVLAVVTVADNGAVTYQPAADAVAAQVATARRILLYVHGITGDTRALAASARTGWLGLDKAPPGLAGQYDLILTFDYESINTTIEQTARDLKDRLAAVGLGPEHGKTLHMVGHSMGGLVARWLVEREGGNRVVQQLVLVGTPNAGSPWPTVQDWALATLAIGLNSLSTVTWPVKALASLVSATEAIDVSLDQMNPKSEFLASLASSPDPGVSYTLIAGNTSVIPAAQAPETGEGESRLARLWAKIQRRNWVHTGANLAFFNQPNDMAVSVESMRSVPDNRTPKPVKVEVACDHVTYFSSQAGLDALADAAAAVAAGGS